MQTLKTIVPVCREEGQKKEARARERGRKRGRKDVDDEAEEVEGGEGHRSGIHKLQILVVSIIFSVVSNLIPQVVPKIYLSFLIQS